MFACLCKYKAERSPRATSLAVDFCVCLLIAYISAIHVFTILYNLDLLKFEEFDLKGYLLQDKQTKLYNGKLDEEYNWNVFYPVWKSLKIINLN